MTYTPFLSICMAEQLHGSEKKKSPPSEPQSGVRPIDPIEKLFYGFSVLVEPPQPVGGRPAIVLAAPPPLICDLKTIGKLPYQSMTRHDPTGEIVLRDPVTFIGNRKPIGRLPVRENVQEHAPSRGQRASQSFQKRSPIRHMLEHFDRDDAVKTAVRLESVHISANHIQVRQALSPRDVANELALRARIGHGNDR